MKPTPLTDEQLMSLGYNSGDPDGLLEFAKNAVSARDAQWAQMLAGQGPVGYEQRHAIKEAHRNAAAEDYFAFRPAHDHAVSRTIFEHGFDRGYDAAPQPMSCDTCVHYKKGSNPLVSVYESDCFECSQYYANKWELKK